MAKRRIGPFTVEAIGLGAMSLSHAYGRPPAEADAARLLHHALDSGVDFIDTAALYGFGRNESLIGDTLKARRGDYVLASKCGMTGVDGKRVIDGRPETIARTIDESLRRLRTDVIDLLYLHRHDPRVPIEESVGALAEAVAAGKARAIGLSEVSADTLRRAHRVHPVAALQTEYSPWSREAEIAVLDATAEIGAAFVAFSPVARGLLAGGVRSADDLVEGDIRRGMPRFQGDNLVSNLALADRFADLARSVGITPAQLSLAWVLARRPHVLAIPGTTSTAHLDEDFAARAITVDEATVAAVDALVNRETVAGDRYPPATQAEIGTEQFG